MVDEEILRKIIKDAVQETLMGLGFNLHNMYEVQADMQHLRKLRKNSEDVASRIRLSVITVTVPAVLYLVWNAVKRTVGGG